jgi:hypothetical protein
MALASAFNCRFQVEKESEFQVWIVCVAYLADDP